MKDGASKIIIKGWNGGLNGSGGGKDKVCSVPDPLPSRELAERKTEQPFLVHSLASPLCSLQCIFCSFFPFKKTTKAGRGEGKEGWEGALGDVCRDAANPKKALYMIRKPKLANVKNVCPYARKSAGMGEDV